MSGNDDIQLRFGGVRAVGDTKRPLYYLTVAGILNIVLNLFFVIVFIWT